MKLNSLKTKRGFALFLAVVMMGTLLLIAAGVVNLAYRQSLISFAGRESQTAFYAADTAMECALYWDVYNPTGTTAFATSTGTDINCNYTPSNVANHWVVGGSSVSVMGPMSFYPDLYCATVTVTKNANGTTLIESKGYNTCSATNPRRVERAVRATY